MDTELTNRVAMLKTVSTYLNDHASVWNSMTPLQAAVTQLNNKISEIDAAAQKQETPIGSTTDKAAARNALEDVMFLTCEALGVLAHTSDDHDLNALTSLTRTNLDRMGEEELSNRGASVLAAANAHKSELATLQVTQANLDELGEALQNFNAAKSKPRTSISERSAVTQSLPKLVNEAGAILRQQVDRMVNLFSRSNPDFVAAYRGARVIVDRAATHAAKASRGSNPTPTPNPNP